MLGRLSERELDGDSVVLSLDWDESKEYLLPSVLPAEFYLTDLVDVVGIVSRKQPILLIAQQADLMIAKQASLL